MHRLSDPVPDRSRPEPVIPSGCVPPDGMGSTANHVKEAQRKLREPRKPRMACSEPHPLTERAKLRAAVSCHCLVPSCPLRKPMGGIGRKDLLPGRETEA